MSETIPDQQERVPTYQVGEVVRHLASHNRYQEYFIRQVVWDSSEKRRCTDSRNNWKIAEVTLPVHNLITWEPKES